VNILLLEEFFDNHKERATVCNESKTTVGKISNNSHIVILYDVDIDVDVQAMLKLMGSEYLTEISKQLNIKNEEIHFFEPLKV
jgi:hypothetical protein